MMERRDFLKTVGATAAAVAAAGVAPVLAAQGSEQAGKDKPEKEGIPMGTAEKDLSVAERLSTYCGRYCGDCPVCRHNAATSVAAVRNVVEAVGFKRSVECIGWPMMRDFAAHCRAHFETEVKSFAEIAPTFFPISCRGGCVPCEIAKCCKGKGYTTCADCGDLAGCSKIDDIAKKHPESKVRANLQDIAKQGLKQWAQAQFDAAKAAKKHVLTEAIDKALQ